MYKTKIGHVHLKVQNLKKAVDFYTKFLNLNVSEQVGDKFIFLSGGDSHHEIALQDVGENTPRPSPYTTGLFHIAFEVSDKKSFVQAYHRLTEADLAVHTVNYGISWAMYFSDPDSNGLEIYVDTRNEPDGQEFWRGMNSQINDESLSAAT